MRNAADYLSIFKQPLIAEAINRLHDLLLADTDCNYEATATGLPSMVLTVEPDPLRLNAMGQASLMFEHAQIQRKPVGPQRWKLQFIGPEILVRKSSPFAVHPWLDACSLSLAMLHMPYAQEFDTLDRQLDCMSNALELRAAVIRNCQRNNFPVNDNSIAELIIGMEDYAKVHYEAALHLCEVGGNEDQLTDIEQSCLNFWTRKCLSMGIAAFPLEFSRDPRGATLSIDVPVRSIRMVGNPFRSTALSEFPINIPSSRPAATCP